MSRLVMDRRAADNEYLHKDFHAALNRGIQYLHKHFGEEAVHDYLRDFVRHWHAPLQHALATEGLAPLKQYLVDLYAGEGVRIECEQTADELVVHVPECPALTHLRSRGEEPSPLFQATTTTVYEALCEGTPFTFELRDFDPVTGRGTQAFARRKP